jgi:hypothetical protein
MTKRLGRLLRLALGAVAYTSVACADATGPGQFGTYALVSVDGHAVPFLMPDEPPPDDPLRILGGTFVLRQDGTFTMIETLQENSEDPVSLTRSGTFSISGNAITATAFDGNGGVAVVLTGTWVGDDLTLDGLVRTGVDLRSLTHRYRLQ